MNQILRTLIFDNCIYDTQFIVNQLEKWGYQIIYQRVETLEEMQEALSKFPNWDLFFADQSLPNFSTQETFKLLKEKCLDFPFVILSGSVNRYTHVSFFKYGINDYVLKGELQSLDVVIERELKELNLRKRHRQLLNDLGYLAYYQPLTGLANQTLFKILLGQEIKKTKKPKLFAVLYIDLDRFQTIKYTFGHRCGEQLIIATVERLKKSLHPRHTLGHLSNDQFVILLKDLESHQEALAITYLIHQLINSPFQVDGVMVSTSASIGLVFSDIGEKTAEDFLQFSDSAMHQAKILGKGQTVQFENYMIANAQERLKLETDLLQGIKNQEFFLNYQPIVSLATGKVVAFEALVRWQHPVNGLIPPDKFIPVAEETGLIILISEWIILEACKRLGLWQQLFPHMSFQVNVNLSTMQLNSVNLLDLLDRAIKDYRLKPYTLKIEITETILINNYSVTRDILTELKKKKIKIALDDFGTGYSCLNYLNTLPIDTIKLDRSFLKRDLTDKKSLALIKSIINLVHNQGLDLVAEGIETEEEVAFLRSLDCEYGQGYLFSRPLNYDAAEALMRLMSKLK